MTTLFHYNKFKQEQHSFRISKRKTEQILADIPGTAALMFSLDFTDILVMVSTAC